MASQPSADAAATDSFGPAVRCADSITLKWTVAASMIQQAKVLIYVLAALAVGLLIIRGCVSRELRASLMNKLIIATVISQVVAFMSPLLVIYHLTVGALIPILARQRYHVAPLYLYLLLTLPLVSTPLTVGGVYLLSYDVGISLAIGALIGFAIAGSPQGKGSIGIDLLVVLLVILFTLAYSRGTSTTNMTRVALDQIFLMLVPYLIVRRSVRTPDDLQRLMLAIIVAAVALSTLALFEAVRAWPVYRAVWDHYGIDLGSGASVKLRGGFLRSPGPYPEPTSFAFILAVALVAAVTVKSVFASRTAHLVAIAVLAVGILAPQSRGAWLGAGAGILAVAVFLRNWPLLAGSLTTLLIATFAALGAARFSPKVAELLSGYSDMTIATDYRATLFSRGITEFWNSPVTGASYDHVVRVLSDLTQGEGIVDFVNSYLFVGLIGGGVGLLVYALSLAWPMIQLLVERERWASMKRMLPMKAAVFGALAAMTVMLGFTSLGGRTTIILVVFLALAGMRPTGRVR